MHCITHAVGGPYPRQRFGIPVENVCEEEFLSEFELYFSQLWTMLLQTSDKDKQERLKANLANLTHEYSAIRQDRQRCPFRKEHMQALRELRKDKDNVITRPDKGSGAVLLNKADYISKTMAILGDKSMFECVSGKL